MIDGNSVLAIIPARGGSKGIPKKNIRNLAGKPLIAWTIEEAKKSKYIDRLILSSDDPEIIETALQYGCEVPFVRPKELSMDDTPGVAPVLHAIKNIPDFDYIVLLQPTSPLRSVKDIDGCLEFCVQQNAESCVSVMESEVTPYWMFTLGDDYLLTPFMKDKKQVTRRQDAPKLYQLNGAIYVNRRDLLIKKQSLISENTIAFIMPPERSIDIDIELDFQICEAILNRNYV